jgi:hypothetical protein
MAFSFPLDKLGVINSALLASGDNAVNVADDGSDEWEVSSPAYERALGYIMESHGWGYAALVIALTPSATAPQDTNWDTAFPIPPDCVHIIWVKINRDTQDTFTNSTTTNVSLLYDILGTPTGPVIVCNAQGGPPPPNPPVTPAIVTLKYVSNSGALADSTAGTPTMIVALQTFIMSAIYRGLHEDPAEADKTFAAAKMLLQEARTRYDQQKPKRQFFNSRIFAARRIRRPWPSLGLGNWGGSNIPG